jgi:hypothetical protein
MTDASYIPPCAADRDRWLLADTDDDGAFRICWQRCRAREACRLAGLAEIAAGRHPTGYWGGVLLIEDNQTNDRPLQSPQHPHGRRVTRRSMLIRAKWIEYLRAGVKPPRLPVYCGRGRPPACTPYRHDRREELSA